MALAKEQCNFAMDDRGNCERWSGDVLEEGLSN